MIEILTDSPLNTLQDLGRPEAMTLGVSRGGAMDPSALMTGNMLLGNAPDAASIEVVFFPFKIRFRERCAFAVTGASGPVLLDGVALPADWATYAAAGLTLVLHAPTQGVRAYVSIAGGLDVPKVLGARSTDLKGGFGGLQGRALRAGDRLSVLSSPVSDFPTCGYGVAQPCLTPVALRTVVRCLPAAEYDLFDTVSQDLFATESWTITQTANRVGYRLEGRVPLALRAPLELLSHGIVPGTVQIPSAGMPIVQMADANTCGGYPKIATVIEPDLRLLGQTPAGGSVNFMMVDRDEAVAAVRYEAQRMRDLNEDLRKVRENFIG